MTKQEYLAQLKNELNRNGVSDAEEIVSEYEQHFLFKLADGFAEEEIAAKLGTPAAIAAQFLSLRGETKHVKGKKVFLAIWLGLLGILEGALDLMFFGFIIALFGGALACGAIGIALIGHFNVLELLPPMPYGGAMILGIAMLALAVLFYIAAFYCAAYLKQIFRASLRWRKNTLSDASLPPLPWSPQFDPKLRRRLRAVSLISITILGIAFVLGYAVMVLYTQAWEFWHALGWFGYVAP